MKELVDFEFIIDEDMVAYQLLFMYIHFNRFSTFFNEHKKSAYISSHNIGIQNLTCNNQKLKEDFFIQYIKTTDFFKNILDITNRNYIITNRSWNEYKDKINRYVSCALNCSTPLPPIKTYIAHKTGFSLNFGILWGLDKSITDPVFNSVCLTHEWLHQYENKVFKYITRTKEQQKYCHAFIELCTDYYLTRYLQPKQTQFNGHTFLIEKREILKPYVLEFIKNNNKTLDEMFIWINENALELSKNEIINK